MARRTRPGLYLRETSPGVAYWHIDKQIGRARLRESTGCGADEREAAEAVYDKRVAETRAAVRFGIPPRRQFRDAAAKYLIDYAGRRGIKRDALALKHMDPFIGDLWIDQMHNGSFDPYREACKSVGHVHTVGKKKARPLRVGTINRNVAVAANILNLCARLWRHGNNLPWLQTAPMIVLQKDRKKRKPYPLDWDEQRLFFSELAPHLERMALFDVNTGARDQEICGLKWEWERKVPELEVNGEPRSVFMLPGSVTKNGEPRVLVLNDVAQSVLEQARGEHEVYVFTILRKRDKKRRRIARLLNKGWYGARRRASARYKEELKKECPDGFRRVRAHDLRHTFGRRLRAAGVSFEDRQDLLGHKAGRITTEYSAAEIGNLVEAANRIMASRTGPQLTVLRAETV